MTTIRVHFDGKVLVPEGPVNLPRNKSLEVQIPDEQPALRRGISPKFDVKNGMPVVRVSKNAKTVTSEDIKAAEDEI
jgi:hypothetical protein